MDSNHIVDIVSILASDGLERCLCLLINTQYHLYKVNKHLVCSTCRALSSMPELKRENKNNHFRHLDRSLDAGGYSGLNWIEDTAD
ncbi:unnamed protein product [Sympodiomycopsis kandeliae]